MREVSRRALRGVGRAAAGCYRALVAFGAMWLPLPEDELMRVLHPDGPPPAPRSGPPPWHPERLCTEVPLSEVERGLARQLRGVRRPSSMPGGAVRR
ncbi:DUF6059 family protein [Streptomyces sp. NPDC048301]|uniref:DUF6059 family protein n=1 Tax=unclassified Streptomyces TaxID=2593676 RepID=UPI003444839C